MDELQEGTRAVLSGEREVAENKIFAHPLPFNVIPHIDKFQENGYTKEEMKVTWECRKICGLPDDFPVSCTAVRIPTYRAHSETVIVETEEPVDIEAARKAFEEAPGIKLMDDTANEIYPMPLTATGQYDVEVGRIRKSLVFGDNGLEFFVVGDQLLRGAALNAVLVAEEMAWGCSGIGTAMEANGLAQAPVLVSGDEALIKKYLAPMAEDLKDGRPIMCAYAVTEPGAGSDVRSLSTKAEKRGDKWILNGSKMWITNAGVADWYFVVAYTDVDKGYKRDECVHRRKRLARSHCWSKGKEPWTTRK